MKDWLNTKAAMDLLGVSSTTVKRWADEGLLPYMRTAGGHRRFDKSELLEFLNSKSEKSSNPGSLFSDDDDENIQQWLTWLIEEDVGFIYQQLLHFQESFDDWFETCDFMGRVLAAIGDNWADGDWSVLQEHIASTKLGQAINTAAVSISIEQTSASCLLATTTGEHHAHGILMAQFCMRSVGINAVNAGTDITPGLLNEYITDSSYQLVALSASACQSNTASLARSCRTISALCREQGITLILGGEGAWPDDPDFGHRCTSFGDLKRLLAGSSLTRNFEY